MKKYILHIVILVFVVLNVQCSNDTDSLPLSSERVSVTIKEFKTNIPLEGVTVSSFFCKKYDTQFGACTEVALYSSCITDINGICNYALPANNFHDIAIEKTGYWMKWSTEVSDEFILQPEAWVHINFITGATYPATSYFSVLVIGEKGSHQKWIQAVNSSTSILTLYGNENNKIEWTLYETYNASSPVLSSGNFELKPEKFENLLYTLSY